jgi:hypothetical protein
VLLLDEPIEPSPVARAVPPEVPVVKPARRPPTARLDELPEAQPLPAYRRTATEPKPGQLVRPPLPPVRDTIPEPPRPRIFLAMFVLFAMAVAFACGLSVIAYAIYAGLKASRPGRSAAPPGLVVPCDHGPGRVA